MWHLSRLPVFGGLPEEVLASIADGLRLCTADKGETLFRAGEPASDLYCIVQGAVRVFRLDPEGREKVIHLLVAPALVAEVPVFTGSRFPASAECTDECVLLVIPRESLLDAVRRDPELPLQLLAAALGRMRELTQSLVGHSQRNAVVRVASYLMGLAHGRDEVELPAAKKDVASYLGLQPESFSRALGALKKAGAIRVEGQMVTVVDRTRLDSQLAGG